MSAVRPLKFRRQQVIHPFIADFACMKARLLVELDGASPDSRQDYDVKWHQFLRDKGFGILRFSNEEIAGNLDNVVLMIFDAAENLIKSQTSA